MNKLHEDWMEREFNYPAVARAVGTPHLEVIAADVHWVIENFVTGLYQGKTISPMRKGGQGFEKVRSRNLSPGMIASKIRFVVDELMTTAVMLDAETVRRPTIYIVNLIRDLLAIFDLNRNMAAIGLFMIDANKKVPNRFNLK